METSAADDEVATERDMEQGRDKGVGIRGKKERGRASSQLESVGAVGFGTGESKVATKPQFWDQQFPFFCRPAVLPFPRFGQIRPDSAKLRSRDRFLGQICPEGVLWVFFKSLIV